MENKYELTKDFKSEIVRFLSNYLNYEEILKKLRDEEKVEFTENEINEILNLLGSFRLSDVFYIMERFKTDVTILKPKENE